MEKLYRFLTKAATTACFVGYLPVAPGTFGTVFGLACYYFSNHDWRLYCLVTALITLLGFMLAGSAEKVFNKKDPRFVVIDEVSGILISLAFVPRSMEFVIAGFFLFRLLDTLKPYPLMGIQNMHGSRGIMLDDIVAGLYTNVLLQVVASAMVSRGS